MTGQQRFGYVYGGTVTFGDQVREVDGTAWSLGRCDEVRLRAAAIKDVSRTEGVPLAGIEITSFWYSEISVAADLPHPCTDPFGPRSTPTAPDPFRPEPGTHCPEDAG